MSFWFSGQTANNSKKNNQIKNINSNKISNNKIESVEKNKSELNSKEENLKINNSNKNDLSKEDKELLIKNIYKLSDQLDRLNNKTSNISKESVISDLEKIEKNIINKLNTMNINKNMNSNKIMISNKNKNSNKNMNSSKNINSNTNKFVETINRGNLTTNMKMNVKKEMIKFLENLYKIEEEREELKDLDPNDLRYFVKKIVSIIKRINKTMNGNSLVRKELIQNLIKDIERDNRFNDIVIMLLEHNNK
jgi:hypothetical protein